MLPDGEINSREFIDAWVSDMDIIENQSESYKELVLEALVTALTYRSFRTLQRHKWNSARRAVCDVGLSEICFGLPTPAFREWARRLKRKRGGESAREKARRQAALDEAACENGADQDANATGAAAAEYYREQQAASVKKLLTSWM